VGVGPCPVTAAVIMTFRKTFSPSSMTFSFFLSTITYFEL
jgi:hypothetical protein